jgi:hypothetical protein
MGQPNNITLGSEFETFLSTIFTDMSASHLMPLIKNGCGNEWTRVPWKKEIVYNVLCTFH